MIAYLFLYCSSILLLILENIDKKKSNTYILIFMFILILFSGLRFDVGVDFLSYSDNFDRMRQGAFIGHFEFLFKHISFYLISFGVSNQVLFFLYSLIIVYLYISFYKKYSSYLMLSIFLFTMMPILYLSSFNGIRQFISVGIFLFSLQFLIKRQLFKYLIYIFIASLFHKLALLMIPLYYILNIKSSMKFYIILLMLYVVAVQFVEFIAFDLLKLSTIYLQNFNAEGVHIDFKLYIFIIFFIVLYIYKNKLIKQGSENNLFLNMFYIGILIALTPLMTNVPLYMLRITGYFIPVLPILLVNILPIMKQKTVKNIYFIILFFSVSIYFFATIYFKGDGHNLVPYIINLNIF